MLSHAVLKSSDVLEYFLLLQLLAFFYPFSPFNKYIFIATSMDENAVRTLVETLKVKNGEGFPLGVYYIIHIISAVALNTTK
jgi:hypothetical protein